MRDKMFIQSVAEVGQALADLVNLIQSSNTDTLAARGRVSIELERAAMHLRGRTYDECTTPQEDVIAFHTKFHQKYEGPPRILPDDLMDFRVNFIEEELDEFRNAVAQGDLHDALDALVDMEYVIQGTIYLMGLDTIYPEAWKRVHNANMKKICATHDQPGTRDPTYDVIKPAGWQPPDHTDLIIT